MNQLFPVRKTRLPSCAHYRERSAVSSTFHSILFSQSSSSTTSATPLATATAESVLPSINGSMSDASLRCSSHPSLVSDSSRQGRISRAGSFLSSLSRRLRQQKPSRESSQKLDPQAAERLREFYQRNKEASRRNAQELERRATLWRKMEEIWDDQESEKQSPLLEKEADHVYFLDDSRNKPRHRTDVTANYTDLKSFLHDFGEPLENSRPSSESSPLEVIPPEPGKEVLRRYSSIRPAEESIDSCVALQEYARSQASSAESLISPYDVFSPDVQSTRWDEFREILQRDRDEVDKYHKNIESVRGSSRAATVAGIVSYVVCVSLG